MAKIAPYIAIWLVIAFTTSALIITPINAQTIPEPSVPQFTVQLTVNSHDTAPTYSTDPFTGETITNPGTHSETKTLDIKIKNQPFTEFKTGNEWNKVLYNIRYKGHYEKDWQQLYESYGFPAQNTSSEYTTFSYPANNNGASLTTFNSDFSIHGTVDFQVKAMIGQVTWRKDSLGYDHYDFMGKESAWSSTQTFTFPGASASTPIPTVMSPSNPTSTQSPPNMGPTSSPQPNSSDLALTLALVAVVVSFACVIFLLLYVRTLKRSIHPIMG